MLYRFTAGGGEQTWIGHSGGAPGAKAVVLYSPADSAFAAVALTGDGPAEASANLLLAALRDARAGRQVQPAPPEAR
jgi:D-alanyl-D-alanine carboxypeptidase